MKPLLALIILAPLLLVPTVSATPQQATGSFIGDEPVVTSVRTAGRNTIITQEVSFELSGTFRGTCAGTETDILREDSTFTVRGQCTFTGAVGERSGTAVFVVRGVGTRQGFHGHFVSIGSSGGLEGLHTWGTAQVTGPGSGTYSGQYVFSA